MRKRRFKIISHNEGDKVVYDTKILTWFGWVSFSVFYKSFILHVFSDPVDRKDLAYDRIETYCQVKGHKPENIVITEVNNS
jgi:hypothetical protein